MNFFQIVFWDVRCSQYVLCHDNRELPSLNLSVLYVFDDDGLYHRFANNLNSIFNFIAMLSHIIIDFIGIYSDSFASVSSKIWMRSECITWFLDRNWFYELSVWQGQFGLILVPIWSLHAHFNLSLTDIALTFLVCGNENPMICAANLQFSCTNSTPSVVPHYDDK